MIEDSNSAVPRRAYGIWRPQGATQGEVPRHWLQAAGKVEDRKPTFKEPDPKEPDGRLDAAGTDSDPNAAIKKERAKEREGEQPPEPKGGNARLAAG